MNEHSAYGKFAAMMLQEDSEYIPQILKCMINDAQAELLVSLPGTAAQMAEKLDRAVDAGLPDDGDLPLESPFAGHQGRLVGSIRGGRTDAALIAGVHDAQPFSPSAEPPPAPAPIAATRGVCPGVSVGAGMGTSACPMASASSLTSRSRPGPG